METTRPQRTAVTATSELISRDQLGLHGYRQEYPLANPTVNSLIQQLPFFGRREARPADRAGAALGDSQPPPSVTSQLVTRHHIILREIHPDELGGEIQD